jgi:hypothetical protein
MIAHCVVLATLPSVCESHVASTPILVWFTTVAHCPFSITQHDLVLALTVLAHLLVYVLVDSCSRIAGSAGGACTCQANHHATHRCQDARMSMHRRQVPLLHLQ